MLASSKTLANSVEAAACHQNGPGQRTALARMRFIPPLVVAALVAAAQQPVWVDKPLHGEMVCFGILVQLHLEEIHGGNHLASQARKQLFKFLKDIDLPTNLEMLGLGDITDEELKVISDFACKEDSEIHKLPFKVNPEQLREALINIGEIKLPNIRISNSTEN